MGYFMKKPYAPKRVLHWTALRAVCLSMAILLSLCLTGCRKTQESSNMTILGISLNGRTKEDAKNVLRDLADRTYAHTDMVVTVGDETLRITPAESHVSLDVDAVIEAAFSESGTAGNLDISQYLRLDTDAIGTCLEHFRLRLENKQIPTSYLILGTLPDLTQNAAPTQTLSIVIGHPGYTVDWTALYQDILQAYRENRFSVDAEYTLIPPKSIDLDTIYQDTFHAPVSAENGQSAKYGYGFDLESAKTQLASAAYGDTLNIPFVYLTPSASNPAQTNFTDVLALYRTPHTDDADRNTNLYLACKAINGVILEPGAEFSYNRALGERTAERGYRPAESYVNGMTVDTLGGGICQVSSTLYYCTLTADLETVERYAHSYVPAYMPMGTDAAVSWGTKDFRFRNTTHAPIRIEAWMADGYVYVKLLGTEEKNYTVQIDYDLISTSKATTVYQEYSPDNAYGYQDGTVLVTPYDGATVKTYCYFYDRDTGALLSKNYVDTSRYRVRNQVICKIVSPDPPPTTPENPQPTAPENPQPTAPEDPQPTAPEDPQPTAPEDPQPTAPEDPQPTAPEDPQPTVPENPQPTAPEDPQPTAPEATQSTTP